MVRAAYRNYRFHNYLTFLFSARSAADIARRIAMLRVATEYRVAEMRRVAAVRKDVQAERTKLAKRKDELSVTKRRLDNQRKRLRADMAAAKKAVSTMSSKQQRVLRSKMEHEDKLNAAIKQPLSLVRIAAAMKKMEFEQGRSKVSRGFYVVERSHEEVIKNQRETAHFMRDFEEDSNES